MTPEERERMYSLCRQIAEEKSPPEFLRLVEELNDLLERKEHRLEDQQR